MKNWIVPLILLSAALNSAHADDMDLYEVGSGLSPILLVLDVSASMEENAMSTPVFSGLPTSVRPIYEDLDPTDPNYSFCNNTYRSLNDALNSPTSLLNRQTNQPQKLGYWSGVNRPAYTYVVNGTNVSYPSDASATTYYGSTRTCHVASGTYSSATNTYTYTVTDNIVHEDRVVKMKKALLAMLADNSTTDFSKVKLGLMHFGHNTGSGPDLMAPRKINTVGVVDVAAAPVTSAHRLNLAQAINNLQGTTGTPTFPALAEATAYMMGKVGRAPLTNLFVPSVTTPAQVVPITTPPTPPKPIPLQFNDNGFTYSVSDAKNGSVYDKQANECAPGGIFLLTDGDPSPMEYNYNGERTYAEDGEVVKNYRNEIIQAVSGDSALMCSDPELEVPANIPGPIRPAGQPADPGYHFGSAWGWACMGRLSKFLYTDYPAKTDSLGKLIGNKPVKTGMLAYGRVGKSLARKNAAGEYLIDDGNLNCSTGTTLHIRNFCKLTGKGKGYGEGGFSAGDNSQIVADSFKAFIDVPPPLPVSTGVVRAPDDPYALGNVLEDGFMPLINVTARNALAATQYGNLKKYKRVWKTDKWVYAEKNNQNVLTDDLEVDARSIDYWNTNATPDGDSYKKGGIADRLVAQYATSETLPTVPKAGVVRNVLYQANSGGYLPLFDITNPNDRPTFNHVKATPTDIPAGLPGGAASMRYLYRYLGYDIDTSTAGLGYNITGRPVTIDSPAALNATYKPELLRTSIGALLNSEPLVLPVKATMEYRGKDTNGDGVEDQDFEWQVKEGTREYSLLYGSSDGIIHVINQNGVEKASILPKSMFNQIKTLDNTSKRSASETIKYGVDGLWTTDIINGEFVEDRTGLSPDDDATRGEIRTKEVYVFGGSGRGASAYFGFKFTGADMASPSHLWTITPSTTGFSNMGQTWGKPLLAQIKYNGVLTKVLILPGGYDPCYDNPAAGVNANGNGVGGCSNNTKGSELYVVNAKTGARLWKIDEATVGDDDTAIKNSIVASPVGFDRYSDGTTDHVYVGDLGGDVWRIDFLDKINSDTGELEPPEVKHFARLNPNGVAHGARFFAPPVFTHQRVNGKSLAMISIASGNRSKLTDVLDVTDRGVSGFSLANNNAVFAMLDYDVSARDFYDRDEDDDQPLVTRGNLVENPTDVVAVKTAFSGKTGKLGWYRPFMPANATQIKETTKKMSASKADLYAGRLGTKKAVSRMRAYSNILLLPVFDAAAISYDPVRCFTVRGYTYVDAHCLPYGTCKYFDESNKDYVSVNSNDSNAAPSIKTNFYENVTTGGTTTRQKTTFTAYALSQAVGELVVVSGTNAATGSKGPTTVCLNDKCPANKLAGDADPRAFRATRWFYKVPFDPAKVRL